jgi:hypothetical protein
LDWAAGPRIAAEFAGLLQHAERAGARSEAGKLLSVQHRAMVPFTEAEQAWLRTEWGPQRLGPAGGFSCHALVAAKHLQARLATAQVLADLRPLPLTCNCFEDEGYAIAWLQTQPGRQRTYF